MATALVFRFQRAPLVTPGLQLVREGRPPKTGSVGSPFGCSHLCLGHRRSYLGLFRDIFFSFLSKLQKSGCWLSSFLRLRTWLADN